MIDPDMPHVRVAQMFMERKGLGHLRPIDVEKLSDEPCWYFYYQLPEGDLELEVSWSGDEWQTAVTDFRLTD